MAKKQNKKNTYGDLVDCNWNPYRDIQGPNRELYKAHDPNVLHENLRKLGIDDQVPTVENFKPLFDQFVAMTKSSEDIMKKTCGTIDETILIVFYYVLSDPGVDHDILRYAAKSDVELHRYIISNASCPIDVLKDFVKIAMTDVDHNDVFISILINARHRILESEIIHDCAEKSLHNKYRIRYFARHKNTQPKTLRLIAEKAEDADARKSAVSRLYALNLIDTSYKV